MIGRVDEQDDRPLVLLDLDHTIICAVETAQLDDIQLPKSSDTYKRGLDFEGTYEIFPRPGLELFLTKLFKQYRVGVWTAAGSSYAMFIIKNFVLTKPSRTLEILQWSDHCDHSEEVYDHQKKMHLLEGLEPGPFVILDDSPDVMDSQEDRVVDSQKWDVLEIGSAKDKFLLTDALPEIKQKLDRQRRKKEYVLRK